MSDMLHDNVAHFRTKGGMGGVRTQRVLSLLGYLCENT